MDQNQTAILLDPLLYAERNGASEIAWVSRPMGNQRVWAIEIVEDLLPYLLPVADVVHVHGVACDIAREYTLHGYDHAAGRAVLTMRESGPGVGRQQPRRGQFLLLDVPTRTLIKVPRFNLGYGRSPPDGTIPVALRKAFDASPTQVARAMRSPRLLRLPYMLARETSRPPPAAQPLPGLRGLGIRLELEHGMAVEATRILRHAGATWCLSPALVGDGLHGARGDEGHWHTLRRADVVQV